MNNAIVIDDPFASAEHAVLTYRGRRWYVEDLGSTNGTSVNGRTVTGRPALGFGDELGIGQVRLRLERARSAMSARAADMSVTCSAAATTVQRRGHRPHPPAAALVGAPPARARRPDARRRERLAGADA